MTGAISMSDDEVLSPIVTLPIPIVIFDNV